MSNESEPKDNAVELTQDTSLCIGNVRKAVKTVAELIAAVQDIVKKDLDADKAAGRVLCKYYFRGEVKDFSDKSSRPNGFDSYLDRAEKGWLSKERDFYHDAYRMNPDVFVNDKTMVERLTRMQHYRLPTRFADLSCSALLAAYFACEDFKTTTKSELEDGIVRIFKVHPKKMKRFTSDIITAIAHLPLVSNENFVLSENGLGNNSGLSSLCYEINRERPGFSLDNGLGNDLWQEIQQVWAFEPTWNNDRIRYQEGIFLAFGCKNKKASLKPTFSPNDFSASELESGEDFAKMPASSGIMELAKIPIAAEMKKDVAEDLRNYGILGELVYPELSDTCKVIAERAAKDSQDDEQKIKENARKWIDDTLEKMEKLTGESYEGFDDTNAPCGYNFKIIKNTKDDDLRNKTKPERNVLFWKEFHDYCHKHGFAAWSVVNEDSDRSAYYYTGINVEHPKGSYSLHFSYTKAMTVSLIIYTSNQQVRQDMFSHRETIEQYLPEALKKSAEWEKARFDDENGCKRVVYSFSYNETKISPKISEDMVSWMTALVLGLKEAGYIAEKDLKEKDWLLKKDNLPK